MYSKLWDTGGLEGLHSKGLGQDLGIQEVLNKAHQASSVIIYIADAIQGILNVCEASITLIRTILTTSETKTREVLFFLSIYIIRN